MPFPKKLIALLVAGFLFSGCATQQARKCCPASSTDQPLVYPLTRTVDQVDEYHGTKVADPYRWLEDDNSAETAAWVKAQNKVTFGYLKEIPSSDKIKKRITKLWNYEKYGMPFKRQNRYFYFKNDGLQDHYVLYTMNSLQGKPRVLLDPNKLSKDGTVNLSGMGFTEDGSLMAYATSDAGSDWQEWRVRDVKTGKDLDDHLKWTKFTGASWTHDNKGFFFSRFPEPKPGEEFKQQNFYNKLYYHRLGTKQSEDTLIYERLDNKEFDLSGSVTEDGNYLIITITRGTERKNMVAFKDLTKENSPIVELIDRSESQYSFLGNEGPIFWFRTDQDAPLGRVVAVDSRNPSKYNCQEIIPQTKETLRSVGLVNDMFVTNYMKDARSLIRIYNLDGSYVRDVELPGVGTADGFGGQRQDVETFYSFKSFTIPSTIYRYNMKTGESELFRQPKVDFNPEDYVVKQISYKSPDGTKVPMFITHKKGMTLDGNNPTYLYGYGGFNVSLTPRFSVSKLVWMEMGGVYAMPNIRGGGEYGKKWHEAGMKLDKQNCFDDFIAAAEWLIEHNYTSSKKLAIGGGSNGGLLVGACMTQRPELFGAALPAVGVMDMLRFIKFTVGSAWTSDYGSPDNLEEFKALHAYSPLHNLKPGTSYPATMVTTSDHDDRVFPAHSFKFAAALQKAHQGDNPVLIRIETRAGHGAGKPTWMIIEEITDQWAFLVRTLNMALQ